MGRALIAGGSKGLGRSLAEAFARQKMDLLLISRNQQELETVKEQIEKQYPVRVEIFSADLSLPETGRLIYDYCIRENLAIKIFCYAAGLGGANDFQHSTLEDLRKMIHVNLESSIALSYLFIPLLKQSAPSYILLIGSMAGFAPISIKAVYSAGKSALISFSYSLRNLLKADHISVSCACPGPMFTKASIEKETIRQLGWIGKQMAVKPEVAGEIIVTRMLKGSMIIVPGRLAVFFSWMLRMLPDRLIARISC